MHNDYLIISLYGSNRDDPQIFETLEKRIDEIQHAHVIIGGDWNLVLDFSGLNAPQWCSWQYEKQNKNKNTNVSPFGIALVKKWQIK